VRNLAVLGLPLAVFWVLALGDLPAGQRRRDALGLPLGAVGVLLAGALAPESSLVHEYYQLPLMLFLCPPLLGLGWVRLRRGAWGLWSGILLGLLVAVRLTVLTLDYWRVETRQARELLPLAGMIRRETTTRHRLVLVSGSDPTLLNLSRHQGWLTRPAKVTSAALEQWQAQGATHIAGSFERIASYEPFPQGEAKRSLRRTLFALRVASRQDSAITEPCDWQGADYVIPLPAARPRAPGAGWDRQ
jgi:hypothetical protein